MKIVVIYQYFGSKKSGWSTRFYDFAMEWQRCGHAVEVITSPYYKSDIKKIDRFIQRMVVDGINVTVVNTPDSNRDSFLRRATNAILFAIASTWLVLTMRADTFIFSSGPITVGIPMLFKRIFQKKRIIFEHRDIWPDGAIEMGLLKGWKSLLAVRLGDYLNRKASSVIVCSEGMKDVLDKRGIPNVMSIPHGCDMTLLEGGDNTELPEWTQNAIIFLYAGSLGLMDSVDEAIHGFANANVTSNCHLVILGDGADRLNLENMVLSSGKSNQIHFLGLVTKNEMAQWYRIAHVSFVLFKNFPILSSSSPNKFFDSLAFGVPVIQNTKGWIYDIVNVEGIGYNVVPCDQISMSMTIEKVINNYASTKAMGSKAKALAKNSLDRNMMARQYLKIIEES